MLTHSIWCTAIDSARASGWEPQRAAHLYRADAAFDFNATDAATWAAVLERLLNDPDTSSELDRLSMTVSNAEWRFLIDFLRRGAFTVRSC